MMREIGKQIATSMFCGVARKKIIKDMLSELRGGSYPVTYFIPQT